jgi:hypothetical protein
MVQPYASAQVSPYQAHAMMAHSLPLSMVQMNPSMGSGILQAGASAYPGASSGLVQAQYQQGVCPPGGCPPALMAPPGGALSPPGMPFAPGMPPPGGLPSGGLPSGGPMVPFGMQPPGMGIPPGLMPGMGAPGMGAPGMAGAANAPAPGVGGFPPGAVAAVGALPGSGQLRFGTSRTQVRFVRPSGMKVQWYTRTADCKEGYSDTPIDVPGRYNFLQAAVYRLKLTNIPGQPGLEIYPTLEVVPANPHTEAFLAHSAVPLSFSPEDFRQIASGNYVVKVIYLPSPENQDLAFAGPDEVVSTQLAPGEDPLKEAMRRGSILLVIRMGNMDQEAPNTPPISAPGPGGNLGGMPQGMPNLPPGTMLPYGLMNRPGMMPGGPGMAAPGMMAPGLFPGMPNQAGPGGPQMPMAPGAFGPNGLPAAPPGLGGPNGLPPAPPGAGPTGQLSQPGGAQLTSGQSSTNASRHSGSWFQLPFVGSPGQGMTK